MTDNEIIKALECCTTDNCQECPLVNVVRIRGCMTLWANALDLINRQKAEIEQWKEEANKYQSLWVSACNESISEAIKEFAKELMQNLDGGRQCITHQSKR